jgi:endonuclease/exonuclease/phosphatase family metal-dependent hydrolase
MKTYLNCVFWNIKDALPPNQRGAFVPKSGESEQARQSREANLSNNRYRADRLVEAIIEIAAQYEVDLFLFAEYHLNQSMNGGDLTLLTRLAQRTGRGFLRIPNRMQIVKKRDKRRIEQGREKAISTLSCLEPTQVLNGIRQLDVVAVPEDPLNEEPFDEARLTLRALYLPGEPVPLLLACVHLVSKRYADSVTQREEARRIARRIRHAERAFFKGELPRTVIVGDFNMNPWEEGMTLPDAFHSVEWYDFGARRAPRGLWGRQYGYHYNPTWALWGDGRNRPGGTYLFADREGHITRRWNLFDQVPLRPATLDFWPVNHPDGCLRIIDKVNAIDLTSGKMREPDVAEYSDHLPILFRLGKYDADVQAER